MFALLLAALTCLPNASAQYPGGGGYPGSGPAPGWHPVKPHRDSNGNIDNTGAGTLGDDALNSDPVVFDYDWSPLSLHFSGVYGYYPYEPFDVTEVYTPGTISGYQYVYEAYASGYPTPTFPQRPLDLSITGASTFFYQWVPPVKPGTSVPDWDNFPAPPLFVLGRVVASAESGTGATGDTGLTGNGSVSDGLGDGWNPTFSTVPGRAPGSYTEDTRRGLLPVGSGALSTFTLGPSVSVHMLGTGAAGGYGGGSIQEYLLPITLSSPDIFKRPDQGDGGNQFVYDSFSADLHVPIHVAVTGGSHDDAVWLNGGEKVPVSPSHVDVVVTPEPPNFVAPTEWWAVENGVEPNTEPFLGNVETGDFLYAGLPEYVRDFGDKAVMLKVDGQDSEVAHIQTFFPTLADNHYDQDGDPNWFYYYGQVYHPEVIHNGNSVATVYNPDYAVNWLGLTLIDNLGETNDQMIDPTNWDIQIQLSPKAVSSPQSLRVFQRDASGQIKRLGTLNVGGIHRYEHIVAHEQAHVKMDENLKTGTIPYAAPGFVDENTGQPLNLNWHWIDTDGDGIPDGEEIALGLNPITSDSTESFPEYEQGGVGELSSGDQECLAEIYALGEVIRHADDWHFDWADEGLQYGSRPPYGPGPFGDPSGTMPFDDLFPYRYDSADDSPRTANPPQNALIGWGNL